MMEVVSSVQLQCNMVTQWSICWNIQRHCWSRNCTGIANALRIQICPKKGICSIFLFWGWDWDDQSYSREGSGFLGMNDNCKNNGKTCALNLETVTLNASFEIHWLERWNGGFPWKINMSPLKREDFGKDMNHPATIKLQGIFVSFQGCISWRVTIFHTIHEWYIYLCWDS